MPSNRSTDGPPPGLPGPAGGPGALTGAGPPVSSTDAGLYVHFPYCERKCPYCDFNVHAIPHDDRAYADAVIAEIATRSPEYAAWLPFRSLYFGGGTPSEWAPDELARVIAAVRDGPGLRADAEVTVEVNPGTVGERCLDALRAAGATRFSLGVQSFDARELEALGRSHSPAEAAAIVARAQATGARTSLDLMYALPGQSDADLERSVSTALALSPDHLSAYTLTVEPETMLGRRARLGLFTPMDDDRQAAMIERLTALLEAAGFLRYEVSSFAPPGREAVHNTIYWVGGPYLGVGAGAHSYLPEAELRGAVRRENLRGPAEYIGDAGAGRFSARARERLDQVEVIGDRLMTGVRTRWGLDLAALDREAGWAGRLATALEPVVQRLAAQGLLAVQGTTIRPTARGFLLNDLLGRELRPDPDAAPPRT